MLANVPASTDPRTRLHDAFAARARTDYLFDFWTAFGWTILTFGIFAFYVVYKLAERSQQHAQRRVAELTAANELAWAAAVAHGRDAELRPHFERVAQDLQRLQQPPAGGVEPALWVVLTIFVGNIAQMALYWVLDKDLVDREPFERDVEITLAEIYCALGAPLWAPYGPTKQPHNYGGRIVATIASFGIYGLFWLHDVMVEGNRHFEHDWSWEAALVAAADQLPR